MVQSLPSIHVRSFRKISAFNILLAALFSIMPGFIKAQTASYSFSPSAGTFTPISGTIVAPANSDLDEGYYNNIPLGFTFRFYNADYTTVSASTNGWMTFGQSIVNPYLANNLEAGGMRPLVAPWWDDLAMSSTNDFSYTTSGTAPNRIFTAQWMNAKWDWNATSGVISFQVKLYETTGKIEFIYSQLAGDVSNFSGGASIGIASPGTGPNSYVSLLSANPDATASSSTETANVGNRPLTDQVYTFLPGTITMASPSPVSAGNINPGSTNNILSAFQVTASGADAVLNNLSYTTSGTCTGTDITNLKLFFSSNSTFPGGTPLMTISTYTGAATYNFNNLNSLVNGTGYYWIVCDLSSTAVLGHTINVGANPVLTFAQGTPSGSIAAGGIKTIAVPSISINSSNPSVAAGNIILNTIDNAIYRLDVTGSTTNTTITGLRITITGTFVTGDVSGMKLYYSTDAILSPGNDVVLGKKTNPAPGLQNFLFSQLIPANGNGYFFLTSDVPCSAVSGHTIYVNPVLSSDVTVSTGTVIGSGFQGGVQTLQNLTPANPGAPSAVADITSAVLTWTAPTSCYDQVMIVVKAGSSVTAAPSGDGSAYSGNLAFGSGTAFDGGFVVYSGTVSPQTVTGLITGNTYYFKFFSRKGTLWSPGIEVNSATAAPSNGEYRSATTGDWGMLQTWQVYSNGTWSQPTNQQGTPTNLSGKITIRSGHTVTMRANTTADQVTVDAGGVLNIINNRTLTIANGADAYDLIVNGSVVNLGTITVNGAITFNNGATYEHQQNDGIIPTATWNTGSTCLVTGTTNTAPTGLNQAFYNFTWNCAGQGRGNLALNGNPANVSGTFRVSATGSGQNAGSISPGGNVIYTNFVIAGGTYNLTGGTARTINVTNFTLLGGTLNTSDAAVTGTMSVSGNFTATGGTITETGTGSGNIVFNGTYNGNTGIQTYTSGVLVTNTVNFTVNPNAFLQMAAEGTVISGGGTFTLSSGATLGITSVNGIAAAGTASGNIQTTSRAYNTGANYIYNLTGGAQFSGSGLPVTPITGKVTISANVILTSTNPIIMDGTLTVDGTLLPGQPSHVFSGAGTMTGTGRIKVTRTAATPDFLSQYTIASKLINGATIDYYATAGGQVVSSFSYGNLTMSNTSGTNTLGGAVDVSGTLTTTTGGTLSIPASTFLTATSVNNSGILAIQGLGKATIGTLTNNGTLNLNSTSMSDIFSLMMDNYSGSGIANVGLFVTGGGPANAWKWHYVAVPANINKSVFTAYDPYNLMSYDDSFVPNTLTASDNDGWLWHDGWDGVGFSRPSFSQMIVGKGYSHLQPNATVTINIPNLSSLQTNLGTIALQYSGTNKLVPANYGKNLLGNSLTCGLDWNLVTETGDVDDAVYYLTDYKLATYLRGAPTGINGGTNFIPPLQGFVVIAHASGSSLNFSAARVHTTQARLKKSAGADTDENKESAYSSPFVKLQIINTTLQDETLVWFNDNATTGFEGTFDASKMFTAGTYDQIYTVNGGTKYGINGLALPSDSVLIPVALKLQAGGGPYQINASQLQGLDGYKVVLKDNSLGKRTDLKTQSSIDFANIEGFVNDRFTLIITKEKITTGTEPIYTDKGTFKIYPSFGNILVETLSYEWDGRSGSVKIMDLSGKVMSHSENVSFTLNSPVSIPANLSRGIYLVEIKSGFRVFTGKVVIR